MRTLLSLAILISAPVAHAQRRADPEAQPFAAPAAVAPGQTTRVTFTGPGVANATGLWASFTVEAKAIPAESNGAPAAFDLTLSPDAPVGIGAVRVVTAKGVSNLIPLMVDDLLTARESEGNRTAQSAQPIAFPSAIEGACDEQAHDYYRFTAKAGQRVSVEVVAARLGSQLDPVLRLLDAAGRELAYCEDAPGAGPDCRLAHTFADGGEYVIELRDVNYAGGAAFRYHLRVGDFPLVTAPYPLGAKRGTTREFLFLDHTSPASLPGLPELAGVRSTPGPARAVRATEIKLPAVGSHAPLSAKYADGHGSGFASVLLSDLGEHVEAEPNGTAGSATPLPVPCAVSARLDHPADRDWYAFNAKKGDRLSLRSRTRTLGLPCDLRLRAYKPDGSRLAESRTDGPTDAALDVSIPDDGTYRLRVEDLNRAGGPDCAYRIEIAPGRTAFALALETDKVEAAPGGEFTLKVTATRRDYNGPIKLALLGIDPELKLDGEAIAEGKTEAQLKVKLPDDFKPSGPAHFSVVGRATVDGTDVAARASTEAALKRTFPRLLYPPAAWDGLVALGVRGE